MVRVAPEGSGRCSSAYNMPEMQHSQRRKIQQFTARLEASRWRRSRVQRGPFWRFFVHIDVPHHRFGVHRVLRGSRRFLRCMLLMSFREELMPYLGGRERRATATLYMMDEIRKSGRTNRTSEQRIHKRKERRKLM